MIRDYSSTDDGLRWWSLTDPDKRFIVLDDDSVSFSEADEWVDRIAVGLCRAGAMPGDRIAIVGENSIEWCIAGLAVLRVGCVLAAIGERSTAHEMSALTEVTDTTFIFVSEAHAAVVHEVARPGMVVIPLADVVQQRTGEPARFERPQIDSEQIAAIIYSSGSTGMPKGVALSMRALLSLVTEWSLIEPDLGREARLLLHLPLAPIGGFVMSILRPAVVGGTAFLQRKFDEKRALEMIVEDRVNTLWSVPQIFQRISALPAFKHADLSALTNAGIGGAPVPLDEFDKWNAKGVALVQIYGSTEGGGTYSAMTRSGARENPDRVGRGSIFRKMKVVRPDGSRCDPGEDGEILVCGPSIMSYYWGNPEATAAVLCDGWLHTGDLGQADAAGYVKVTDRIKEVIISGGYNVGPTEVENALLALDGIAEAVVLSVPDNTYGEGIGAVVYATKPLSADEIIQHCRGLLAGYKVPRYLLSVDHPLPRTNQSKVARAEVRERYAEPLRQSMVRSFTRLSGSP